MKVLITGHDGYIGAVITPAIEAAGFEVFGLDTAWFRTCTLGDEPGAVDEWLTDVRDLGAVEFCDRFGGFDAVVHLAALSNDPLGNLDPTLTHAINHRASVRLAELARRAGITRFVFSSSCSLYGASDGNGLLDENAPVSPVTAYGETKILAERDIARLAGDSFSPVFLRNATAFGMSPRLRADVVVNNLVGHAVTAGEVLMTSDGSPWRPLVHVGDIGLAVIAALTAPIASIHNEAFNIGRSGENYQVRDIAQAVAEAVPESRVAFGADAAPDRRNYRVDFSKAETRLLGFEPQWTLRRGIEELVSAYRDHGLTHAEFLGSRYVRVEHMRELQASGSVGDDLRWVGGHGGSDRLADRKRVARAAGKQAIRPGHRQVG